MAANGLVGTFPYKSIRGCVFVDRDAALRQAIFHVYEAAEDDSAWASALKLIADHTGSTSLNLLVADGAGTSPKFVATHGADLTAMEAYQRYYAHRDVWLERAAATHLVPGRVTLTDDLISEEDFVRTEFYNDFLRHVDIGHGCGVILAKDACFFNAMRPLAGGAFNADEAAFIEMLVPHFQRSLDLRRRLAQAHQEHQDTWAALERLSKGVALLDHDGRVLRLNRAAERFIRRNDAFVLRRTHSLGLSYAPDDHVFQSLIRETLGTSEGKRLSPGGQMLCARRGSQRPYMVTVSPVSPHAEHLGAGRARAVIFMCDPEEQGRSGLDAFARHYKLTRAETRLLAALVEDKTIEQAAEQFGVSITTVRTQLHQILAKTDTLRQAHLLRMVMSYVSS